MNIFVMSRAQACRFFMTMEDFEKNSYACISIRGMEDEMPSRWHYPKKSLFLTFDDVDKASAGQISEVPMSELDAKEIAGFVKTIADDYLIKTLIVHCEAGMSRSAGVAAAIMKWQNNDDTPIFNVPKYRPNMLCYRLTLEALMDKTTAPMSESFVKEVIMRVMSNPEYNVKDFTPLYVSIDSKNIDRHLLSFKCSYTWTLNGWEKRVESDFGVLRTYKGDKYVAVLFGYTKHVPIGEDIIRDAISKALQEKESAE